MRKVSSVDGLSRLSSRIWPRLVGKGGGRAQDIVCRRFAPSQCSNMIMIWWGKKRRKVQSVPIVLRY